MSAAPTRGKPTPMMVVEEHLVASAEAYPSRRRDEIVGVVVHRIEVSQEDPGYGDTASEVARFFAEHPLGRTATGGKMPYTVLVDRTGAVTQCVPLLRITPHAKSHNPTTVGVGVIGDFRTQAPPEPQRLGALQLVAALVRELNLSAQAVHGHDELNDASHDPNKECPGRRWVMSEFRADVAALLASETLGPLPFLW